MTQHYSNPERESDKWSLPDIEVFQLTAWEVAELDADMIREYMRRQEFRLANISGRTRSAMLDAMVEEEGIEGGWFYWYCLPGCMPDSDAMGPYATHVEALAAAREEAGE